MPENILFPPEGLTPQPAFSVSSLRDAMERGDVLEAVAQRCDPQQNLRLSLGPVAGILPRAEALSPWISGRGTRNICDLKSWKANMLYSYFLGKR